MLPSYVRQDACFAALLLLSFHTTLNIDIPKLYHLREVSKIPSLFNDTIYMSPLGYYKANELPIATHNS